MKVFKDKDSLLYTDEFVKPEIEDKEKWFDPCERCDGEDEDCIKCKAKYRRNK